MSQSPTDLDQDRFLHILSRLRGIAFGENPMQEQGLSVSQIALLEQVAAQPGAGVQEIAAGLGLTAPTVSVAVRQLEEAGWLARQAAAEDRRALHITLTPAGQALFERARDYRRRKAQLLLEKLSPAERAQLLDLLERAVRSKEV